MAGKIEIKLEVEGLDLARALTKPADKLIADPWRKGIEHLASRIGLTAQRGAPQQTGKLVGSVRVAIHKQHFPKWIAVRVHARRKGYPYPLLLEFSRKHHHKDWLLSAVQPISSQASQALESIADEIAKVWEH